LRFYLKPRGALPQLPAPEEVAVLNLDPQTEQEGIWYLCHTIEEIARHTASPHEEKRVVSPQKYRIETSIARNDHLTATADFRFRAVSTGDRVVSFGLLSSLRVTRVTLDGQIEVPYIQEDRRADGSFYVVMPEPMAQGRDYRLVIEYNGDKVIHKSGGGNFSVGARTSWYPSVNAFNDRATYDLVFKIPKAYTLVSVGKLVKDWREGDSAASEWVSDIPLAVAGFNYGDFTKKQIADEVTHYTIEGYAASQLPNYLADTALGKTSPTQLLDQVLGQTRNALHIYDKWFGKDPYGRIAITQQPEFDFGQSWPGLVYLPISAYLDATQRWMLMGQISTGLTSFIQEVTPHEVSHQWWGHVVGWATYHDQWLSEGFADFSAGLYLQLTEPKPDAYWKYLDRSRELILEKSAYGRVANDAGPIWMGLRLDTMKNEGAYARVVYSKGGYVLHMLRTMMFDSKTGDEGFIAMMRDFVEFHYNRNASTESFQKVAEKHMTPAMDLEGNKRLNWFFAEWVHGTEIPRYKFSYTISPEPSGGVVVNASLTQSEVGPNFAALVPFYADVDGKLLGIGRARIAGSATLSNLTFHLPKKPKRVLVNANYDVLARK
jgi:aminopeptidase N